MPNLASSQTQLFELSSFVVQSDFESSIYRILPMGSGRAVLFGYGYLPIKFSPGSVDSEVRIRYFLAEVRSGSCKYRELPADLHARFRNTIGYVQGSTQNQRGTIKAFKLGDRFGLLVGSAFVQVFDSFDAEPKTIPIANGFGHLAQPKHPKWQPWHYLPVRCGYGTSDEIPVIFAPAGRAGGDESSGRAVALLNINVEAGTARFDNLNADGRPPQTQFEDYRRFYHDDKAGMAMSLGQMSGGPLSPVLSDCAWDGEHLFAYAAGFGAYKKPYGVSPTVCTKNRRDLSIIEPLFEPEASSHCFGYFAGSLDRVLLHSMVKTSPRKGKPSVGSFKNRVEEIMQMPRGYADWSPIDYFDGDWWLIPRDRIFPLWGLSCRVALARE